MLLNYLLFYNQMGMAGGAVTGSGISPHLNMTGGVNMTPLPYWGPCDELSKLQEMSAVTE